MPPYMSVFIADWCYC